MKKIVVLLAAITLAGISQAATLTWSITNMQAKDVEEGWLVAIYEAGTAFDYDAAKAGTLNALYTGYATLNTANGSILASASGLQDTRTSPPAAFTYNDPVHGSISAYAVVFNSSTIDGATQYLVSDAKTATVKSNGANIALAYGTMAGTTTANAFLSSTWASTGGSSDVPEPTSGLLLALGGAILALRRRR